ncbi:SNF1-interacting protein [Aphanomyces cochlioides]|nr:SNF1-interacting protein [Aphanomyces cochlioides]
MGANASSHSTGSSAMLNTPPPPSAKKTSFGKSKSPMFEAERFTRPTGLYKSCLWEHKVVRKLIAERKIAPRYPGSDTPGLDSYECPICFMYYPSTLNQTKCCKQAICTECYLQTKPPSKTVWYVNSKEMFGRNCVCSCPFCNTDNFETLFTVGSSGSLKPILRSDSDCTELSSPEGSLSNDDIEVHFASVADRKKLQEELSAQVAFHRPQSLPNHRSTTFAAFLAGDDSTSRLEEMMLMEAIRRSMLDCENQPKQRDLAYSNSSAILHRSEDLIPSAAPSAAS